jgi:CTP-dependent riboflavin kinase
MIAQICAAIMCVMISVVGTVTEGLRAASGFTIAAQMPFFLKKIPEIATSYHGTINLRLDRKLRIDNPDREIFCMWAGPPGEMFGFLEIGIEFPINTEPHQAWIYIPHDSPHHGNRFQVEIISEKIEGLAYGSRCGIRLPRGIVESDCIVV